MVSYHPYTLPSFLHKRNHTLIDNWLKALWNLPYSQAWHVTKFWIRWKWKMIWNFLEDYWEKNHTNSFRKYLVVLSPFPPPAFRTAGMRAGVPAYILDQEVTLRMTAIPRMMESDGRGTWVSDDHRASMGVCTLFFVPFRWKGNKLLT